ncbi:apolipoprotein N-acyltransferase [Streptomyces armeniacus]|uniref:Apolipoprotein N-acyltransferase n=1 Tax=Streptomyces armeniacus TaxID=83291 RepID=A0A345XS43_9ACTN|nr:apolipoprotein N-acyltransferase [Streptomyces armeniacus]AXK34459.1 apolipoprotein N-acyltransferase [Streptomyces armeniacus]
MRMSLDSPWSRGAFALGAGALPALTFPAPSLWWFAPFALVPWLLLLRSAPTPRRAGLEGWAGGTGFMLAVHHWLLPNLHVFLAVLAALLGLLWLPWGRLVRRLLHGSAGPVRLAAALVLVPSGWLLAELVRSWEYLGGPWGLLGASQWQVPPALRLASVGGVWLVSFLLVAVNTAVAALFALPSARVAAVAAVTAVAAGTGAVWTWAPAPEEDGRLRVAVVQPGGTPSPEARFARSEQLTRQLAGRGADLVVWGESSVGFDLRGYPGLERRLAALSRETGAELLVNVDARGAGRPGIFKSSVLVGPQGVTGQRYDKMRLVPFGEYVPFRSALGWATSVGRAAGEDRRRGEEPVVEWAGGVRTGPLICFESAFPDMSRRLVQDGARLLVAQSSTSTFQHSWAPQQHASLAALRSAESWRPMVHATLTGESAVYGPRGEPVGERLGTDAGAARVYTVPLASGTSPYVRFGDWVVYGALGSLALFCGALGVRRARRTETPRTGARTGAEAARTDGASGGRSRPFSRPGPGRS